MDNPDGLPAKGPIELTLGSTLLSVSAQSEMLRPTRKPFTITRSGCEDLEASATIVSLTGAHYFPSLW